MSDKIIQLNEDLIKNDLKDLVRNSVEETLNALLDKEAEEKLKGIPFETAIIERYRRRESSVVEALSQSGWLQGDDWRCGRDERGS